VVAARGAGQPDEHGHLFSGGLVEVWDGRDDRLEIALQSAGRSGTSVHSSRVFVAAWMAVVGAGMGLALATSTSAALVELCPDRSGVGTGVVEAIDEIGGPLGIAILGSVITAGYLAHFNLSGLPGSAASPVFAIHISRTEMTESP